MWREMVSRSERFFERPEVLASGRVLRVRYEDLVARPLEQGEAIAAHLGQRLTARMREQLERAHPRSIGSHRRREQGELREAERVAGQQLAALSYSLESPAAQPAESR